MKKYFIYILFFYNISFAQDVYYHISNTELYLFIDEMASLGYIEVNSAVKPYTRIFIANKLVELNKQKDMFNTRQKNELEFYLKDFNKELFPDKSFHKRTDLFFYKDSLFTLSINPIIGINGWSTPNKNYYHRWEGADVFGYIGKHIGFYANLRDNHESVMLERTDLLTDRTGASYKIDHSDSSADYSEMRGGITYSWKWGTAGLLKDHFSWGNNYNGSTIFSGRTPSFTQIKLHVAPVKWMEFNYVHGWLVSGVVDSTASYKYAFGTRGVFYNKYIAANLLTVQPVKKLYISIGNSVVYSANQLQPAYFIPVFFYKSVDHNLNNTNNFVGQNSQMFLDISSRQIKKLHLYTSLFLDEISFSNMWNRSTQSNFFSFKAGINSSDLFVKNIFATAEFTLTHPLTYTHFIPTTTFESNGYNLGHYLGDNARETFLSILYKPYKTLSIRISYILAEKGPHYLYTGTGNNGHGFSTMESVQWRSESLVFKVKYQIINDVYLSVSCTYSDTKGLPNFMPSFLRGNYLIINSGLNWGF